jgi:hypothetical protein
VTTGAKQEGEEVESKSGRGWSVRSKARRLCDNYWGRDGNESKLFGGTEEVSMLLAIGVILLVLWALGFLAFHVAGGFIHLLIVLAVISFIVHLFRGRRSVA